MVTKGAPGRDDRGSHNREGGGADRNPRRLRGAAAGRPTTRCDGVGNGRRWSGHASRAGRRRGQQSQAPTARRRWQTLRRGRSVRRGSGGGGRWCGVGGVDGHQGRRRSATVGATSGGGSDGHSPGGVLWCPIQDQSLGDRFPSGREEDQPAAAWEPHDYLSQLDYMRLPMCIRRHWSISGADTALLPMDSRGAIMQDPT